MLSFAGVKALLPLHVFASVFLSSYCVYLYLGGSGGGSVGVEAVRAWQGGGLFKLGLFRISGYAAL